MLQVSEVFNSARIVLADKGKVRWTEDDLIDFLNDALDNLAINSNYTKTRSYIEIENGIAIYDISDYAITIDRVEYLNSVLVAKSAEEMDKLDLTWVDTEGTTPQFVIFDNLPEGSFRIYPRITAGAANIITQNQLYGGLIDITCVDDLYNLPASDNLAFQDSKYLVVHYTAKPQRITSVNDTIDIMPSWKGALVAFITGMALRADKDTQSRQFGAEQLSIYDAYLKRVSTIISTASNSMQVRTIPYRGFQ